jgi:hypothetical protein
MKTIVYGALILAVLGVATGCSKGGGTAGESKSASAGARSAPQGAGDEAHAQKGVVPGSYEDWCGEHAVPESQCTRCNPTLVAAFKATGDWCAEHGLPESQCLACNPDLKIERPPKPTGS